MENPVGKKSHGSGVVCRKEPMLKAGVEGAKAHCVRKPKSSGRKTLTFLQEEEPLECNSWSVIHNQHNKYWLIASSPQQKNWAGVELGGCLSKQLQLPGAVVVEG